MAEAEPVCASFENLKVERDLGEDLKGEDLKGKKAGRAKIAFGPGGKEDMEAGDGAAAVVAAHTQPPMSPHEAENGNGPTVARTTFSHEVVDESLHVPDRLKFEIDDDEDKAVDTVEKKAGESDDSSSGGRFAEFETWLLENGAQFPELYLKRYTGDVRGVHSKRRVGPYVCIVQIPLNCLITDHMGRTETQLGRKLFSSNYSLSTPNLIAVIVYILTTREDPNNFFQPYYKILPRDYSNFPIFWDKEQLSWLTGSPLIPDIVERKRNMRADYDEVCRVCPEFKRFSFEEFLEVRTAVGSRNFGIVVHGNKRTAMVPYADMLNHYRPRETSWTFEDSKNSFTITSLSPLQAGQQVMDSYGKKMQQ
mmetsp:Transcript_2131/g.4329  ORF Transcript_2131/g.4329 Transcript_2131/m.4329 type:complete len:365 (-) Transcript_2131:1207-2301(-)